MDAFGLVLSVVNRWKKVKKLRNLQIFLVVCFCWLLRGLKKLGTLQKLVMGAHTKKTNALRITIRDVFPA